MLLWLGLKVPFICDWYIHNTAVMIRKSSNKHESQHFMDCTQMHWIDLVTVVAL